MDDILLIKASAENAAQTLKNHFPVNGVITKDVFVQIYIDVEGIDGVTMDYGEITDICRKVTWDMVYQKTAYDCIVAVYTENLPKELK